MIEKNKLMSDNVIKRKVVGSIGPQGRMLKVGKPLFLNGVFIGLGQSEHGKTDDCH